VQRGEAAPHLTQALGGDTGQGEQRLQVRGGPVAVGAPHPLHGARRLRGPGGEPVPRERQAERGPHSLGHAGIVEEDEGVARVEEDRAEPAQRNLSSAASPSIASCASGS